MLIKNLLLVIFLLNGLFIQSSCFGQEDKVLSTEQAQNDFELAIASLKNVHPSLNAYLSIEHFDNLVDSVRNELNSNIKESELHIILRKIISQLGCGHTLARPSENWYASLKNPSIFPLSVYMVDDRIFVKENHQDDTLLIRGMEIVSIEGKTVGDVLDDMRSIQQRDGISKSFVNNKVEQLFRSYYLFLYGMKETYQMEYLDLDGVLKKAVLKGGSSKTKKKKTRVEDQQKDEIETSSARFYVLKDDPERAVLDIDAFQQKKYKKFYKTVFKEIENKGIKNLVLDLRNNGGGYFPNGNRLLKYLVDEEFKMYFNRPKTKITKSKHLKMSFFSKMTRFLFNLMPDKDKKDPKRNYALKVKPKKKNHFEGKIYVLINGASFSLSSYTASMLNKHTDAVFIGEECGGGENGSNAILDYSLTLPESGIRINIPYYYLDHKVTSKEEGRGVKPDHDVQYLLNDRLAENDKEREKVQALLSD